MVDRQRDAGPVCLVGCRSQRLDRAGGADRRRRGVGNLLERATADPLRDHQPTSGRWGDVEHSGQAGGFDAAEGQGPGQDGLHLRSGKPALRVDERQRHLPIQRDVEGLPELQPGRPAVKHQQPVAAVGNSRAGYQVRLGTTGLRIGGGAEPRCPGGRTARYVRPEVTGRRGGDLCRRLIRRTRARHSLFAQRRSSLRRIAGISVRDG